LYYTIFDDLFWLGTYLSITTPISPHEAKLYYTSTEIPSLLMHWGESLLGGFVGLRVFFIFFGFLSIALFYAVSQRYFREDRDVYVSTVLFMFLPGILTATTLVNVSIIVLPLVLFFVLMYEKGHFWSLPFVMLGLFFVHEASIIFFVALLMYGIMYRDKKLLFFASVFLGAFIFLAKGIEVGGRPSGHFLEIFGLYATLFSPLVFLYFFYVMYRILLREKKTLLWYISFTALALSLLLSIRQRVYITDFAPYVSIAIILMLEVFNNSLRVRLKEFQKRYMRVFLIVIGSLAVSIFVIVFHQFLFLMTDTPSKHFANRIYKPYFLAKELKSQGIDCYDGGRGREVYQLRYYNISTCSD
jgi:hypothetical protein